MTSKILALTDALGNLVRFILLPGQRNDIMGVAPLIQGVEFDGLIADTAFDANWLIADLNQRGAKVVISQMPQRKAPVSIDREVYKWRHLIENFFMGGQINDCTPAPMLIARVPAASDCRGQGL